MKINKIITGAIFSALLSITSLAVEPKPISFVTTVGSTQYEASRAARSVVIASRLKVHQQVTRRNNDGTWQIILKCTSK